MFFLRSIRRRLVSGFAFLLLLNLVMAAAGFLALYWHQQSIAELEYVLYQSPDRSVLTRAFNGILSATAQSPVSRGGRQPVAAAVRTAQEKLELFFADIDRLETSRLLHANRMQIEKMIGVMHRELQALAALADDHPLSHTGTPDAGPSDVRTPHDETSEASAMQRSPADSDLLFSRTVLQAVSRLHECVNALPEYQDRQSSRAALQKEQRRSVRLAYVVAGTAASAAGLTFLLLWGAFRWISTPLRTVTLGASRIAEGDHSYRIPRVSRWDDEFSSLRANVNLMAERFERAEQDLHEQVRERSNQLIRSERLAGLGFLAAGVAHEINNPLSIIRMAADTVDCRLRCSPDEQDEQREEILERIGMIRQEAVRCGQITARILDFARGDQKDMQVDDLTHLVQSVVAMVQPMPNYRDRTIVFERNDPLPLLMNGAQMKQVVLNLLFNALQATEPGGRVEIRLQEHVDWAILEVEDDGCGMSSETMANLFEPFYSTKPPGQGTGLGMPITHRIVTDHDGTIEPVSAGPGQGTLIRVRLPRRTAKQNVA